jgi:hypothetical protein
VPTLVGWVWFGVPAVFKSTPATVCLEFPDLEFDGNTFVLFELEIVL